MREFQLDEFDPGFKELGKSLWEELPSKIQFYDPQNPNYVFIVPKDFYQEWYRQKNASETTKKMWDKFQVKPSYDFPGGSLVKDQHARYHALSKLAAIGAAAGIIIVGGALIIPATAGAMLSTAELIAALEAAAAARGPIIVSARIAAQVGAGYTATGATIGMTAGATAGATGFTFAAVAATPAVKATVATAGVLLVVFEGTASASTKKNSPKVTPIRAVAVDDFQPLESVQTAVSGGPPTNFSHTPETAKGKFKPNTLVLFDAVPHVIIGTFSVR